MKSLKDFDREIILRLYETMLKIRLFERTQARVFRAGEQEGFTHLYLGAEAVATGVCANLNKDDYITSTHRGHGHMIAKGGDFKKMMAELYGRSTGYCLGRSGSLHIADRSIGVLGANGIVGDGNPIAVGAGYSIKLRGTKQVVVSFFGDGATNQGTFHESVNMAASFNLPVIFVIENNRLSCGVPTDTVCKVLENLGDRAVAYGIQGENIDGLDVLEVYTTAKAAVQRARSGEGPTLINCKIVRHRGHFEGDIDIRTQEEVDAALKQDAVESFEKRMLEEKIISEKDVQEHRNRIQKMIDEAVEFARKSPLPKPEDALKFVYAE
ncbi:MAG: acetoin:2,6-dichlorophenolindophenol oxidoreductase subunit alpha [Spirochaetes bacterium DG_61]|nr:MAG: acetoin:2,6-dichlorophenolindophenol oxidoreductase subunit alpha [Spirochaetes bacterium DG_61]ODS38024.1 MAG: pyruvate dehydrogenase (acetyl-transferring) E1 component subunit alpha [Candidatus Altiarchaeales archaeon WOR_SM1_79]